MEEKKGQLRIKDLLAKCTRVEPLERVANVAKGIRNHGDKDLLYKNSIILS